MRRNLEKLVRDKLASYVAGKSSLREFDNWLAPATWNIAQWASASLIDIVYGTELLLAEHDNGDWTEQQLKEQLTLPPTSAKA